MEGFLSDKPYVIESSGPENRWNNDDWFSIDGRSQQNWPEDGLTRGLRTLKVMFTAATSEDRFGVLGNTDSPENILSQALDAMPR